MTVFTDLLITILAGYFAIKLINLADNQLLARSYWGWAMVALAIGALLGAISHGVGPYFSDELKGIIWKLTIVSIGLTAVLMLIGTTHHLAPKSVVKWVLVIIISSYIIYLAVILKDDRFIKVISYYLPIMILITIAMLISKFILHNSGSGLIALGLMISFIAAGVQMNGFTLHKHFNHNDLYHVIQLVGIYFIYSGARLIGDYSPV